MPNVTFVLKEPSSKEPTLVYLLFTYNGQRLKYSTSQKIYAKFWNEEKQCAKETKKFPQYAEFNTLLKNLDNCINNTYRNLINDKIVPTPDKLKAPLNELLLKTNTASKKDLLSFAEELVNNTTRKEGTKKQLKQAIRNLKEFKAATNHSLHFDSIDLDFYDSFVNFLMNKNYGTNTIGSTIKNVKVFMNEAVDRKLTTNLQFRNKRFKIIAEHSENIYLTKDEIKKIFLLDLSENSRLDRVRDLFVVGCYTGLRFSDLSQLKEENFIDLRSKVKIKTEKTGEIVVIPLHPYIKQILEKNNGTLPDAISNQKMNSYLKELGQLAKIEDEILITSTKGGQRVNETYKKYELVTVHTARRSFATNAYLADVPTISIMKLTGHKTERAFLQYIKISQEDNANKLLNHPFFKAA